MASSRYAIRLVSRPDEHILGELERTYQERCFTQDGVVNPFDQRYKGGGGHFKDRNKKWFADNLGEGSRLLVVFDTENNDEVIGFGLFYVNPATFPRFADDAKWPCDLNFIGQKLAYTYLFIIHEKHCGKGLGWQLMSAIRDECRAAGCVAIVHEYFVRPITNVASSNIHVAMGRKWGAIDTGRTAKHTVVRPDLGDIDIVYAQWLIPTDDRHRLSIDVGGEIRLVAA